MSADQFAGRTVLITGAARGRRAIALTFAAAVGFNSRSHRELEEVASETRARGSKTIALTADWRIVILQPSWSRKPNPHWVPLIS